MHLIYDSRWQQTMGAPAGPEKIWDLSTAADGTGTETGFDIWVPGSSRNLRPDLVVLVVKSTTNLASGTKWSLQVMQTYQDENNVALVSDTNLAIGRSGSLTRFTLNEYILATGDGAVSAVVEFTRSPSEAGGGEGASIGFTGDSLRVEHRNTGFDAGVIEVYVKLFVIGQ